MASPVTVTGSTQTILGSTDVANLTVELCNLNNGIPSIPGQTIITNIVQGVTCTGGSFSFNVYGNDVIYVGGVTNNTFYMVRFYSSAGNLIATLAYQFTGASTIDLSELAPLNNTPPAFVGPVPSTAVLTNPTGTQTISTYGLNLPSGSVANAGTFTATQMYEYLTSILNSLNVTTEYQACQGGAGKYATQAIVGGVATPTGATSLGINAVAGFATSSANSSSRTVANTVAGYFQARALANGSAVWGTNPLVSDLNTISGHNMTGCEIDLNVTGSPSFVTGLIVTGFLTGTLPATACGIQIAPTSGQWPTGIAVVDGAITSGGQGAILIGCQTLGVNSGSQALSFNWIDNSLVEHRATLQTDIGGSLVYTPNGGTAGYKAPLFVATGATPTVNSGEVGFGNSTATTATGGSATLPSQPVGFLEVNIGGTMRKLPYYAS